MRTIIHRMASHEGLPDPNVMFSHPLPPDAGRVLPMDDSRATEPLLIDWPSYKHFPGDPSQEPPDVHKADFHGNGEGDDPEAWF